MIYLRLFSQDKMNWVMAGFMFVWMILLLVLDKRISKTDEKKRRLVNMLCEVPLLVCVLHFLFFRFKGRLIFTLIQFGGFYLMAVLTAVVPFFLKRKKRVILYVVSSVIAVTGCLYTIVYPMVTQCGTRNYTHMNYVDSFHAMVQNMEEYDVLLDWKKIDIKAIEQKILPMVEEARKKEDEALFYAAMCTYTYYFYDGHTWAKPTRSGVQEKAEEYLAGNDYGLSMVRLTDGRTIATLVEPGSEAEKHGISNGTQIVKWNGEDIDTAISNVECIYTKEYGRWPVKENEELFQPIFLAGKGEERITVTFREGDGTEKMVCLNRTGNYRNRLEKACAVIYAKDKIGEKNYEIRMLNDTFGYFRITEEEYEFLSDVKGYLTGHSESVREMFAGKIEELKQQGMKKLIIDIRNNTGGYSEIPLELAALFTKKDIFINHMSYVEDNQRKDIRDEYVKADGRFEGLEVIVLTNSRCVSAGDYLVYCMSKCDHVKIVGMTTSAGSSQPVGGNCAMADGICEIRYPQNWMFDENGNRFVDTREDRVSRLIHHDKIPLTERAVQEMFYENTDYELNYILEQYGESEW